MGTGYLLPGYKEGTKGRSVQNNLSSVCRETHELAAVGALYERRFSRNQGDQGGHRPPLQCAALLKNSFATETI